jgi:hypothetical protein
LQTAISTISVQAFSVSTSAVRTGADGDILATTGKIDVGAAEYSLIIDTGQFEIQFTTWAETGDIGEQMSRSSYTIIDLRFYASSAPISAMTFDCKRLTTSANIMNGALTLGAGSNFSSVFTSTNSIPQDGGISISVLSGRCNGIVHAVIRYFKTRGQ